jgi:hypothetical protein
MSIFFPQSNGDVSITTSLKSKGGSNISTPFSKNKDVFEF